MRSASLALMVGLATTACGTRAAPRGALSLGPGAECYHWSFSAWSAEAKAKEMAWAMPPSRQALTRLPASGPSGSFRLLPDDNPLHAGEQMPFAYWRPSDRETIEVIWSNGFAGVHMTLRRQGRDLLGSAVTISDAGGSEQSDARGLRIECTALSSQPVA
jgi:hypothetical protein